MRTSATTLLVVCFLFASLSSSRASVAKKTYSGSYKGQPCTVKVTWFNWEGLGPVDGVIRVASGKSVTFSGNNSQAGVIELTAGGESFHLVRREVGKFTTWLGNRFSFSEAPAPSPSPSPTPTPSPIVEEAVTSDEQSAPSKMVDETYTGTWRGQQFTAQVRWAPGDAPQIVRRGRGTITTAGGEKFSVEATQSSADAAEFSIKPDASGETYKTSKTTRDGNESWESSSLTLTETK